MTQEMKLLSVEQLRFISDTAYGAGVRASQDELRRLHEDNEMLLAHKDGDIEDFKRLLNRITMLEVALRRTVNALENTTPTGFNMESDKKFYEAITTAKQALEDKS